MKSRFAGVTMEKFLRAPCDLDPDALWCGDESPGRAAGTCKVGPGEAWHSLQIELRAALSPVEAPWSCYFPALSP